MVTIYMQLKTDKRAYTRTLDLGKYITSSDDELNSLLASMQDEVVNPTEQVECSYIGSIKEWNAKGDKIQ